MRWVQGCVPAVAGLVLALTAAGCSGDGDGADPAELVAAGESAEEAAAEMLVEMTSYSHASLEEDFAWVDDYLSPEFGEEYADNVESIKAFVESGELDVTGSVLDQAHRVVDDDPDHVAVLAFVDQDFSSEDTGEAITEELRVRLVLVRDDAESDWTVENLEVIGGQNAVQ